MFEQLVRPFATRPVTTTRRIVPIQTDDVPELAIITWGAVGALPPERVQPQGTDLENIESVGFVVRGNIDNWKQSVRESENIEIPIKDKDDNEIGKVKVNRVKKLTFNGPESNDESDSSTNKYLPNFSGMAEWEETYTAKKEPEPPPAGLRDSVPSSGKSIMIQEFDYELDPGSNFGGDSAPNV
jgi:hypothetical protein